MTKKLCHANCIYSIDGHCRLEHRNGTWTVECSHYNEHFLALTRKTI